MKIKDMTKSELKAYGIGYRAAHKKFKKQMAKITEDIKRVLTIAMDENPQESCGETEKKMVYEVLPYGEG